MKTKNKSEKSNKKKKVISILVYALIAYVITELIFLCYKYGSYSPEYLVAPIIFLLILIYLNTTNK